MDASDTYPATTDDVRHSSGKPFNGTHFSALFFLLSHNTLSTCQCTLWTLRYNIILPTYDTLFTRFMVIFTYPTTVL